MQNNLCAVTKAWRQYKSWYLKADRPVRMLGRGIIDETLQELEEEFPDLF